MKEIRRKVATGKAFRLNRKAEEVIRSVTIRASQ